MFFHKDERSFPRIFKVAVPVSSIARALFILETFNSKRITHPTYSKVTGTHAMNNQTTIEFFVSEDRLPIAVTELQKDFCGERYLPIITQQIITDKEIKEIMDTEKRFCTSI